jgi:hypothetical protein
VPTGTTLTATSGLPTQDATESLTLTHPITGLTNTRTVQVWRHRSWSDVLTIYPGAGETYLFDECKFTVNLSSWVFGIGEANARNDQMDPLFVFRRCEFDGMGTSDESIGGSYVWIINCNLTGTADGWQGGAYSVGIESNIVGYGANVDQHADGFQNAGTGRVTMYHCWISVSGPGQSSAFRCATEGGSIVDIKTHYCTFDGGGYAYDIGNSPTTSISDVSVLGCRWTRNAAYGPVGIAESQNSYVWSDNAYLDGEVIPSPL